MTELETEFSAVSWLSWAAGGDTGAVSPQAGPGAMAELYVQVLCGKCEQKVRGGVAEEGCVCCCWEV